MPFPVVETLRQAVLTILYRPRQWLTAFWPLIALTVLVRIPAEFNPLPASVLLLLMAALTPVLAVVCSCAWHRNLIQGDAPRLRLGRGEWLFFKTSVMIGLITLIPALPATMLIVVLDSPDTLVNLGILYVAIVVALWITTPTMLALPVNALGRDPETEEIKRLTGPHHPRLFALILAFPLAETLLSLISALLPALSPVLNMITVIFWPLGVSVLSLAYIWLNANLSAPPQD